LALGKSLTHAPPLRGCDAELTPILYVSATGNKRFFAVSAAIIDTLKRRSIPSTG
jgi:hypothetical protein